MALVVPSPSGNKAMMVKRGSPEPECCLRGHEGSVQCVRFLGKRSLLASGDQRGTAKLWDVDARRPVASWLAATHVDDAILEVQELEAGETLVTQARDGMLRLWDVDSVKLVRKIPTDAFHFTRCAVAKPGALLPPPEVTVAAAAPTTKALPPRPQGGIGALLASPPPREEEKNDDALDDDDDDDEFAEAPPRGGGGGGETTCLEPRRMILAPSEESAMTLWDCRASSCAMRLDHSAELDRSLGTATSAKLLPSHALICHESGDLVAWDLRRRRIHFQKKLMRAPVLGLDVAADGSRLFVAAVEPKAKVFDLNLNNLNGGGREVCDAGGGGRRRRKPKAYCLPRGEAVSATCEAVEHDKEGVGGLVLRPDARIFATAGWDYRIRLFSAKPPHFKPLAVLRYHDASVNAVDFSPQRPGGPNLLAAASKDTKISLWRDLFPTTAAS